MRHASMFDMLSILALLSCVIPSFSSPVYIVTSDVNLYQQQSSSSTVLLHIPQGSEVKVLDSSFGNWWQVKYSGRTGYTQSNHLRYSEVNDRLDYEPIVNVSSLYDSKPSLTLSKQVPLYEHPATSSAVLTRPPSGTKVKVVDDRSSVWLMVHYQGVTGYLRKINLSATAPPAASPPAASPPTSVPQITRSEAPRAKGTHTLTTATSLRKEADGKARVLLRFEPGDQVEVLDNSGEWWWEVTFKGKRGWVKRRLLEKN